MKQDGGGGGDAVLSSSLIHKQPQRLAKLHAPPAVTPDLIRGPAALLRDKATQEEKQKEQSPGSNPG